MGSKLQALEDERKIVIYILVALTRICIDTKESVGSLRKSVRLPYQLLRIECYSIENQASKTMKCVINFLSSSES